MEDPGGSSIGSLTNRYGYLLTLIVERGLFFLMGIAKLVIVIVRLVPEGYVEYVSVLGLTTFVATLSKLGVEIYIKLEIPQLVGRLSSRTLFSTLFRLLILPVTSVLLFSTLVGVVSKYLGLYPNLTALQISLITLLLAINGLLYATLISLKHSQALLVAQLISSGLFILLYVIFLPKNASVRDFIPLFVLANFLAIIIYIIPIYAIIERNSVETTDQAPAVHYGIRKVVAKMGLSFLFLISTKIIRVLPISFVDLVTHPALISLALIITMVDVFREFFNQGVNYLMITSNTQILEDHIPASYIRSIVLINVTLFLFSNLILQNSIGLTVSIELFGGYGTHLPFAIAVFGYPKLILLLSSALNEGYLMRFQSLKELTISRAIIAFVVVGGLVLYFAYFSVFPALTLFVYLVVAEYFVSSSSAIIGHHHFTSKSILILYLVSMTIPLMLIVYLF